MAVEIGHGDIGNLYVAAPRPARTYGKLVEFLTAIGGAAYIGCRGVVNGVFFLWGDGDVHNAVLDITDR